MTALRGDDKGESTFPMPYSISLSTLNVKLSAVHSFVQITIVNTRDSNGQTEGGWCVFIQLDTDIL